ncbi:dTDP-4-dehydrorhamnose reductase [Halogeometricum borinquense]|uniref:dTDP-4-dehydrorhamnose reductase n=1 Tax=Halogeometricum borinquense TaxID=60847 RepID=UPI0034154B54
MQLLILGANGLLGSNVVTAAQDRGWRTTGTYHSERPAFDIPLHQIDITNTDAVQRVLSEVEPDWVVNCAAMTDVDGCEKNTEHAHEVNARAPGEIASQCVESSIRFLHVSTDYVFDGMANGVYEEDDAPQPIQEYGKSKLAGENEVVERDPDALITRLSFVYGMHRGSDQLTGFPAWVRGRLLDGEQTPLFTDQHVTPTRAGQAAETICDLIDADESGLFHVAARSCTTPYEFGAAIAGQLGMDETLLTQGSQSDVNRPAERPSHTCLDVSKVEETLGRAQPTLTTDLDAISDAFDTATLD